MPGKPRDLYDPSSSSFKLSRSPFYLMAHADFRYHEDMNAMLEEHGVTKSMYRILTVLRERDPASISWLAEHALIKRNTVSRIIEKMVQVEMVEVAPDPNDNRVTEVRLTRTGRKLLDQLTPIVARQAQRAMAGITPEAVRQLVATLQQITMNLESSALE